MTGLLRLHAAMAVVFLSVSIAFPIYYHHLYPPPPLLSTNAEFQRNVEGLKDLEHLRKVLRTVVVGTDEAIVANKQVTDNAVALTASLAGFIAGVFMLSALWVYFLRRKQGEK